MDYRKTPLESRNMQTRWSHARAGQVLVTCLSRETALNKLNRAWHSRHWGRRCRGRVLTPRAHHSAARSPVNTSFSSSPRLASRVKGLPGSRSSSRVELHKRCTRFSARFAIPFNSLSVSSPETSIIFYVNAPYPCKREFEHVGKSVKSSDTSLQDDVITCRETFTIQQAMWSSDVHPSV